MGDISHWTGLDSQRTNLLIYIIACLPVSFSLCLPPPPFCAHWLLVLWKWIEMPMLQALVILQYRCKLNPWFSFKPKWHLTHPSNKSKQSKHREDGGGVGGGGAGGGGGGGALQILLQYPARDNEEFLNCSSCKECTVCGGRLEQGHGGFAGILLLVQTVQAASIRGREIQTLSWPVRQPAPSALIEAETNGRLSLRHTSGD